jgi:hypothetical protein
MSDMDPKAELITLLTESTQRGTLKWTPTARENEFRAITGRGIVTIGIFSTGDDEGPKRGGYLELADVEGWYLKQWRDEGGSSEILGLYERVRDTALDVEAAVGKVLDDLRDRAAGKVPDYPLSSGRPTSTKGVGLVISRADPVEQGHQ